MDIDRIKSLAEVKTFLRHLVDRIEATYRYIREQAEAGGAATGTWRIQESSGHLLFQKKVNGTWTTAYTLKGS